jgi:hypothetical protein
MRNSADNGFGTGSSRFAISPLEGERPDRAEGGVPGADLNRGTPLCHFVTSLPQGGDQSATVGASSNAD